MRRRHKLPALGRTYVLTYEETQDNHLRMNVLSHAKKTQKACARFGNQMVVTVTKETSLRRIDTLCYYEQKFPFVIVIK